MRIQKPPREIYHCSRAFFAPRLGYFDRFSSFSQVGLSADKLPVMRIPNIVTLKIILIKKTE